MQSDIQKKLNQDISLGAYAWIILSEQQQASAQHLTLTQCMAALYMSGAQIEAYVLTDDFTSYHVIILRDRIPEANFMSVFVSLVKHLNTISYGFIDVRKTMKLHDFIGSLIEDQQVQYLSNSALQFSQIHEKICTPQTNHARYLRDQMGKRVLTHFACAI